MKKLFLQIGIGILFLLFVAAVTQYRIRDIQGDKSGDPTLKQELANRYTKAAADTVFNMVVNNINPHDSVWYKDETYHKDTIENKLDKKLNTYQPTITNGTANTLPVGTNTAGLATTAGVVAEINARWENPVLRDLKTLGSPALAVPLGSFQNLASTGSGLTDGRCNIILFRLEKETIITGFKGLLTTLGDYTADNYNGFAIHSVSGSTATKIAETVNDGELWKSAAITKALPTPLTLQAGLYAVELLFNASATVTAPVLSYFGAANGMSHGNAKISSYINLQSTIPESITLTGNVTGSIIWGVYLY